LPEGRALKKIRAVSGEIRDIEEIENLPEDVQFVPLAKSNDLPEPNVC
jgi:hypothetical protein